MYDGTQPMNYNDLFMAQNLGQIPPPMNGAQSPFPQLMGQSVPVAPVDRIPSATPIAGPQNVQMPPEINHLMDVVQQYTQNKQQQQGNTGLVQDILSNRTQPGLQDASNATTQTASSFLAPNLFKPETPDQAMAQRYTNQLSPYTEGLGLANQNAELSGRLMQNNITSQTGLPMAMATLQHQNMVNDIMQKTGMSAAQADIAAKNAQAGFYNSSLSRDLAEKQFEYQNNPQMQQARMMSQYLGAMSGVPSDQSGTSSPGGGLPAAMPQANAQPRFNPMGAMLAKQFGMENMQLGANGQPEPIPGVPTTGQKEVDKNFADALQTFANTGGAQRTQNAIDVVDQTIADLKAGKLSSGGFMDRLSMEPHGEPSRLGMVANAPILVARTQIANAILPQAKSLFGSRVTNFDAQSLINSQGIDPLAPPDVNIAKLERLKSSLISGQQDLQNGGQYFVQHGTLSGYNSPALNQSQATSQFQEGQTATNLQSGQKITFKNGQWQ